MISDLLQDFWLRFGKAWLSYEAREFADPSYDFSGLVPCLNDEHSG
jgi:hypothetical protein